MIAHWRCTATLAFVGVTIWVGLAGCGDDRSQGAGAMDQDDDLGDPMPEDLPAGMCRDDGTAGETDGCDTDGASSSGAAMGTGDDSCVQSSECLGPGVCSAAWDPQTQTVSEFGCEFACIPELDELRWCSDAAGCCDADAVCTARGYCVRQGSEGSSGPSGSSSGGAQ